MMCSVCKENLAVVFVNKFVDGKTNLEGMCLSCAKKQGIQPLDQIMEQIGMNEEEFDNMNRQLSEMIQSGDLNIEENTDKNDKNLFTNLFSNIFNKNNDDKPNINSQETSSQSQKDKEGSPRIKVQEKKPIKKKKFLDIYGINLTDNAKTGKLDRIIGREKEIARVIQILNRRTKNNPVLIGEPGVGKTAIAEGLAIKIIEKQVPAKLFNHEIYILDMTAMIAGTQFRGQFESRMKNLIDEVKSLGNIILVIDELHNIMGAGEAEGAMNAANILKPALSRGEIQVIGATTLKEYKKHIEKDSALERRFQPVLVEEPSIDESIEILKGIKNYYEQYHKIKISDDAVTSAVIMSERYINDRFLPDKAIDVLDEAASRANLRNITLLELESLRQELKQVQEEKEFAVSADSIEDYQKAADLKTHECTLTERIKELEYKSKDAELLIDDIADIIESWTKIPVQRINEQESEKLIALESRLHERVIGQDNAVEIVSNAIRRKRIGLRNRKRPPSFIFVGPTGVGKTELARALSYDLFGSEDAMIKLDMSEYMEKHTVSKLIGAPPGYVGYDEAGQLTEKVRRKPYSVVLFDEIEKAHPDVFNSLLQILEDGRLTDSQGRVISFENTIIIMTSNAGSNYKSGSIGFNRENLTQLEENVHSVLKETFRPEFLNRLDEIVVFTQLNKDELFRIVNLMIKEVCIDLQELKIDLNLTHHAQEYILNKGYDSKYGARPIRRVIQKEIENKVAEMILNKQLQENTTLLVDYVDNKLKFEIK